MAFPPGTHALIGAAALAALSGCASGKAAAEKAPSWHNSQVNAVSKIVTVRDVTAMTALRGDGTLETVALDVKTGKKLWAQPATMAGRFAGMGVQPPAIAGDGTTAVVVAVEPYKKGKWNATLVARDARTGEQKWSRPVHSTFGPARCGSHVCVAEHTALKSARFLVLDSATGRPLWPLAGIAEVAWSDPTRVVVIRLAANPVLESHELATGRLLWRLGVEKAIGSGVNLYGGWAFGAANDTLVGYIGPYQPRGDRQMSAFGFFAVRLSTGEVSWARPHLRQVYPSASPAVALFARSTDAYGKYSGFMQIDPVSGNVTSEVPPEKVPTSNWWLAFPTDLRYLGFLNSGTRGSVYDLRLRRTGEVEGRRAWSFCTTDPKPLPLKELQGFYPVAALCEYDLATGKRTAGNPVPPEWYTGSVDGWRLWRDDSGGVHGIRDGKGSKPGMYG